MDWRSLLSCNVQSNRLESAGDRTAVYAPLGTWAKNWSRDTGPESKRPPIAATPILGVFYLVRFVLFNVDNGRIADVGSLYEQCVALRLS